MSKKESKGIIKLYIDIFGRIDSDWKSMLSPIVVDIEEMTPAEVKHARLYNTIFWCIFGSLALSTVIFSFPNAWGMITGPILTLLLLMLFSALSHNVKIRKSKAGRRELLPVASFAECFTEEELYVIRNLHKLGQRLNQLFVQGRLAKEADALREYNSFVADFADIKEFYQKKVKKL